MAESAPEPGITEDALLGGAVRLLQPSSGYRVAIDPVFLAAALTVRPGERLADLGCGVGAVGLCAAHRMADISVTGLERNPALVALGQRNIASNGLGGRCAIIAGDVRQAVAQLGASGFDHAAFNPPYLEAGRADPSPDAARVAANVEQGLALADWVEAAFALVRQKGSVTVVHRADRLDALLACLRDHGGTIVVHPLWPKSGRAAKRVLVRARKGTRGPLRMAAGTTLHGKAGAYTRVATKILEGGGLAL